jgi:hypothetical protein
VTVAIPTDNVWLALYFRLVVQHGVTEAQLRKYVEPLMHLSAMGFGIVTAAVSLKLTLFNNAQLWCWIAPLPFNCTQTFENGETNNCIRGDYAFIYLWAFFYGPLWLCMALVLILNVLMYWHVKVGQQDAMEKEAAHVALQRTRTAWGSNEHQKITSVRLNRPKHRRTATLRKSHLKRPSLLSDFDPLELVENVEGHTDRRSFKMVLPETIVDRLRSNGLFRNVCCNTSHHISNNDNCIDSKRSSTKSEDIRHVLSVVEDYPSAVKQYTASYIFGTRVVVSQCLAYTAAFFVAWMFSAINRVVQHYTKTNYFGLLLCQAMFEPLQGLFNVLVYRFAFYLRLKTRNPHLSRWELILSTWRWSKFGPPPGTQDRVSLKMLPLRGKSSLEGEESVDVLLSPSTRRKSGSKIGSSLLDSTADYRRESDIGDEVNFLTHPAAEHDTSFSADLMMDYFDNPSLLNQNMVTLESAFPFYISDEDDDPIPGSFPVQVSSNSDFLVGLTFSNLPSPTALEEVVVVVPTHDVPRRDDNEPDKSIEKSPDLQTPDERSEKQIGDGPELLTGARHMTCL